ADVAQAPDVDPAHPQVLYIVEPRRDRISESAGADDRRPALDAPQIGIGPGLFPSPEYLGHRIADAIMRPIAAGPDRGERPPVLDRELRVLELEGEPIRPISRAVHVPQRLTGGLAEGLLADRQAQARIDRDGLPAARLRRPEQHVI